MQKIKCTVMVPTRRRVNSLTKLIDSLYKLKTSDDWELIVAYDIDDTETQDYLTQIKDQLSNIKVLQFEKKGYARIFEYYNEMCKHSRGDWLLMLSDDTEIVERGWDENFDSKEFVLLDIGVVGNSNPCPLYPAIPRKWYDIQQHFSLNSQNDIWLGHIGNNLKIIKRTGKKFIKDLFMQSIGEHQINNFYIDCREIWEEDLKKIAAHLNIKNFNLTKDTFI